METVRLNLGCCDLPLAGWINIDSSTTEHIKADLVADCLNLSDHFAPGSVDEIYCGHLVEHLTPDEADRAMAHWYSLLKPGGKLGIMTPDFRTLSQYYLNGDISIERMENEFVFSYVQESHHASIWDQGRQFELFARHGFRNIGAIDRMSDSRAAYHDELQVGTEGIK